MAEKKPEFVVSDRRRFAPEGERRDDAPVTEEEKPAAPPAASNVAAQPAPPEQEVAPGSEEEELPPPPTTQEQQEQRDAYQASSKKMDDLINQAGGRRAPATEMNFERLIESFYMTALLQLGALRQEGEAPAVDVMGARQTIDSLNVLQEKTKGNLTEREQTLMQNILFELRMAWIEITNAIAKNAVSGPGPGVVGPASGIRK